MQNLEIYNEVIDQRAEKIVGSQEKLRDVANQTGRADALQQLAILENTTPEELLKRVQAIYNAQKEAEEKGEPFMTPYTMRVRGEAAEYGADPSLYAALRTRADISVESLG
ncbi:hypothetical protein COU78_02585 [Candidatus Peregrinibacteria bacterium CG10_big_fil_rev_8_21_14_0_10_49_24]|nr:MAG: hypothetical protein COV83_02565 [Candidatus Peregrinibacteria bacterium CG11_big_fil_rev_8_21_14_0_20_49_14]PIR51024.1 MAG: hypothetical protein COU78_02585 [Candidatus Peregrinibacteria bacterium CG10_big_fil_rev_8_21_14_0_10_49_24]PJA67577.1 MAG: hypothetical protein CO157_04065 [Candidatus Peregrinibacteria bacterium CG_4_9_14_3_um_filter_49_12]